MRVLPSLVLTGAAISGFAMAPAAAGEMSVTVQIPRLAVAEYHRPYVAIWLERSDQPTVTNLAVWYDVAHANNEGTKWLKDMRQWWRRAGRDLNMPVDGLSSATRAPGAHTISFTSGNGRVVDLPAGQYELVVEAAREVGGRELLRLPLVWPPAGPQTETVKGERELGTVTLELKP